MMIGKWKNRHGKPFDCKWTNDKVFTLGLRIGNKDTSEIIFTEQLAKIESKGSFWKAFSNRKSSCCKHFFTIKVMV